MDDDVCDEAHATLRSRRTQLGTLGLLSLTSSTTRAARSLAARRVPELVVVRSALPPPPSPSTPSSPASRATSAAGDDGLDSDGPCLGNEGDESDSSSSASPAAMPVTAHRSARRPRRLVARQRVESVPERQAVLACHIMASLKRLLGMRTLVGAAVGSGMMAQVVATASSRSRFLFCVTGPQAVDLATLWLSPEGATLCSCWGHTENVALLSMAGQDSTCWHAQAFKAAVKGLPEYKTEISRYLRVSHDAEPHAVDITTFRGTAAAAFDGVIYSPVVATRRQHIKCIAVGCRSTQRRCHHATLVRKLERLASTTGDNDEMSDASSDEEFAAAAHDEDDNEGFIEEELVTISVERQQRNLVACTEEDRQGLMWARTAECVAMAVPAAAIFSSPLLDADGQPTLPAEPPTFVRRMAELGLAYDPSVLISEKRCGKCGAQRPDRANSVEIPAVLYTDGNGAAPLEVCTFCATACSLLLCF